MSLSPASRLICEVSPDQQNSCDASSCSSSRRCPLRYLLPSPYVVLLLVFVFCHGRHKDASINVGIEPHSHLDFRSRRLDAIDTPSVQRPDDLSFHPDDTLFDVAPEKPLPAALLRRLAEMEASGPKKTLLTAPLYGNIFFYAYYFVSILVGTPPQRQSVILDTGSSLLGFPCRNCTDCGHHHIDRGFDVSQSSTARWLSCKDSACSTSSCVANGPCSYYQGYSEGSSIEGNYFSDLVALGEENHNNQYVRFDHIGCHSRETNLFVTQKANGILGIAYPKRGTQETLIDALFRAPGVDTKVFAVCASEDGGQVSVGGFNSSLHRPSRTRGSPALRLLGASQSLKFDMNMRKEVFGESVEGFRGDMKDEPVSRLRHLLEEHVSRRRRLQEEETGKEAGEGAAEGQEQENNADIATDVADTASVESASLSIAWTPITSTVFYHVDVLEMYAIEESGGTDNTGQLIATHDDFGSAAIDSGTTFSYLASAAYTAIRKVLLNSCSNRTAEFCVAQPKNEFCWTIDEPSKLNLLPSFLLKLRGGSVVEWTARSYLHPQSGNLWCVAIDNNRRSTTVLGMSFMKQQNVIFDRERDLLGFAAADCPEIPTTARPSFNGEPTTVVTEPTESPEPIESPSFLQRRLLWGSAGALVAIGLLAMCAMTMRTLGGNAQRYQPMTGEASASRTSDTEGSQRERIPTADLEMALSPDEDKIPFTSARAEISDDEDDSYEKRQLGYFN